MNNFDRQCYKKESELPLSKRLVQEFITSPLLGRDRQPAKKSKYFGKNPDVNFLFDEEKQKTRTRKTEKLRKVFNLSDAIHKQVVRINENKLRSRSQAQKTLTERVPKWAGKLNNTTMSYFVEVETKRSASRAESPTTSQSTMATAPSTKEGGGEEETAKGEVTGSQKEFKIITFEKRQSELPVEEHASRQSLRKMSSHVRLKERELKQLYEKSSEKKSSRESITSTKKVTSVSSLKKTISKLGEPLKRQISELDLNCVGEGLSDFSMVMSLLESDVDIPEATKWSACAFPGWEFGQHCHSVAAAVFSKGFREPCISSSSSSDDLFESTKYSRDIIEEKLRGLELEKKNDEEKSTEVKAEKQKKKVKSKTTSKCKCRDMKNHHGNCSRKIKSKFDKKFVFPATSKDSAASGNESLAEHSIRDGFEINKTSVGSKGSSAHIASKENESDGGSQFQLSQGSKANSGDSIGKSADVLPVQSSSSEEVAKRPCKLDTCLSLKKGTSDKHAMESKKPLGPNSIDQQRDDDKSKTGRPDLSERSQSGARLKIGQPPEVESSSLTVRTGVDYCIPETCQFSKDQGQQQKSDISKPLKHSKSEHSRHSSKRKEICSPKTCKIPRGRSKKRFYSKARMLRRMGTRRSKRKHRHFICDCHNLYIDENDSDTDDLWSDKGFKRSQNRRYSLTFENLKKRVAMKCGGHVTDGHHCNCYSCNIKGKPWKRFLKMPNAVLEIPYHLTTKTLKERAQNTKSLLKKLKNKYNWSEENLKNYCTRHEVCKKPNLRQSLLQENPFTWHWRWCHKNKVDRKVKKETPKEEKSGRFGYYVEIKEERLTRGEHFTNIQKIIEKVVYCKWNQDVAEMKLSHFLENMPKQQTCYSEGKTFDPDRRTCYNPKLIKRLEDIVKFSDDPDRGIHEFSFPPKLLKYQEPQLVGDIGTDMPEIRPVYESAKFPTIYRDLFKDPKRDLRKLMDTLLPPLQWTDKAGLWEMKVSIEPDNKETNRDMIKYLDYNETLCHAINRNFCAGRYRLYFEVFAEVIRQELTDNPERAFLLARIREELLLTMLLYDGGLEMTLVSTSHLWKDIEADTIEVTEKETLEKEIEDIQSQIKAVMTATYDLEKKAEEQSQTRDYQNKDQEKHYKKTNHQLKAQFESIKAGLLYDID